MSQVIPTMNAIVNSIIIVIINVISNYCQLLTITAIINSPTDRDQPDIPVGVCLLGTKLELGLCEALFGLLLSIANA